MIDFGNIRIKKTDEDSICKLIRQERFDAETEEKLLRFFGAEALSYPNLIGEHRTYRKFVVLSTQRSGSTYIASLLQSHPSAVCYNEIFHPEKCHYNYPFFPEENNPEMLFIRDADPVEFLRQYVFRKYLTPFSAVGFKLHYSQAIDKRFVAMWTHLLRDKEICFIHVSRANLLKTLISLKMAQLTNVWSMKHPAFVSNLKETGLAALSTQDVENIDISLTFHLDFNETRDFFIHHTQQQKIFLGSIRKHPVLHLTYEDFETNATEDIIRMLNFLHLKKRPLYTKVDKQSKKKDSEVVTNYTELKAQFKETPWFEFFTE